VAKYIHKNSSRSENLFIKINCGAIPENLIESELFGYEYGAFTGALQKGKAGLFEVAHHGSIFLDEIGELQLDMQVKLLSVLESKQINRIGGTKPIDVDVRVIAATNRDLEQMVEQGLFRQDLYYRLHVVPIMIPPLRERRNDIIPLVQLFMNSMNKRLNANKIFSNNAYQALLNYHWAGNVRELRNIVENAMIMSESDIIDTDELLINKVNKTRRDIRDKVNLAEILEKTEYEYMREAYNKYGNVRDAAASLGMSHPTYIRKRKIYSEKFFDDTI
jgi:transcriptional regulator with PAS, ATPase and Fis domain